MNVWLDQGLDLLHHSTELGQPIITTNHIKDKMYLKSAYSDKDYKSLLPGKNEAKKAESVPRIGIH